MTPTRRKRLLQLAKTANADHKRFYPEYLRLMREGLVDWQLGTAFLTKEGRAYLSEAS